MSSSSGVRISDERGVRTIEFGSEKANALNLSLLCDLKAAFIDASASDDVRVVVLKSSGDRSFCAGASFDEMKQAKTLDAAQDFFMGFGDVVLAMRNCSKFIVCRVQGKAVGGAVGLIAAADYAIAHESAAIRLSEITIGLGPFVISAPVSRRIGISAFSELSVDGDWRDASWALARGLFAKLAPTAEALDSAVRTVAERFSAYDREAVRLWKAQLWSDTTEWPELFRSRAATVASLALRKQWDD